MLLANDKTFLRLSTLLAAFRFTFTVAQATWSKIHKLFQSNE
jgi:hypothetical protein